MFTKGTNKTNKGIKNRHKSVDDYFILRIIYLI